MITAIAKVAHTPSHCQAERELLLYFHALNRARVQAVDNEGRELLKGEVKRAKAKILFEESPA